MNVLSLFAGIGGLELGLERAGMTVVGQVELDPYCRRVLAKHWPEVPRHDDVRTAVEWWQSAPRPTVDVVCGGFPCQDISNAGRRIGIGGARSGLWKEMAWVVSSLRPRYVVMENVAAILSRGLDVVAGDLASIGYDLEWDCIPAAAVGAPHRRDRWWGIAYPQCDGVRLESVTEPGRNGTDVIAADGAYRAVADAASVRCGQGWQGRPAGDGQDGQAIETQALADADGVAGAQTIMRDDPVSVTPRRRVDGIDRRGWAGATRNSWWATEPDVGRVAHGIPARVDRLRALGNAVVPQVAEHIGRLVMTLDAERQAAA
jgi:DNA (cytosine-5)-methyltransferase 1